MILGLTTRRALTLMRDAQAPIVLHPVACFVVARETEESWAAMFAALVQQVFEATRVRLGDWVYFVVSDGLSAIWAAASGDLVPST